LILEDILNTDQRPKIEFFENYLYIVIKLPLYDGNQVSKEQISMVLGGDYLLLFEERSSGVFQPVLERLKLGKGRIRKQGCDYLAYALIDVVVDCCFPVLESLGDQIEMIEEALTADPQAETISQLHTLKREIIHLRKLLWPLRELIGRMRREDFDFVSDAIRIFLNDVNDHIIQILDTIDSYKDILSGLTDFYLSLVSNKTNEAMKVLTIIATIFIPMTFIVGIYGMNFKFIPELDWQWGYFFVWGLIVAVAIAMIIWFKRKKLL
jgi:magnesium transporter